MLLAGPVGSELDVTFATKEGGDVRDARLKLVELIP
jgi:hypothetical protein